MPRKNIKKQIMEKIENNEIKMKPKWYFVVGSILLFLGVLFSTISAVFVINLMLFLLRTHYGPMYQYRLNLILLNFPWWLIVIGVISIFLGIKLLKQYDFSYKKNFLLLVFSYLLIIFLTAYLIDYFNLNKFFYEKGFMRKNFPNQDQRFFKNKNFKGPRYFFR
ncbi:MAG: hypothetical protein KatS3mg092_0318 [Patescibacteria group bacterium]|nr:MAG: hypothetical protein KatS3mg092_0318 [Patescibacteria group bacterium]